MVYSPSLHNKFQVFFPSPARLFGVWSNFFVFGDIFRSLIKFFRVRPDLSESDTILSLGLPRCSFYFTEILWNMFRFFWIRTPWVLSDSFLSPGSWKVFCQPSKDFSVSCKIFRSLARFFCSVVAF